MENIIGTEICAGFTERLVKVVQYLELPNTCSIYNAPFEIICWIWFMAYVVNIKSTTIEHLSGMFMYLRYSKRYGPITVDFLRLPKVTAMPSSRGSYSPLNTVQTKDFI